MSSSGAEAVELAHLAGLDLDPWQVQVLDAALGERADGRWAAFEVGLVVPRQNGKGAVLEARELAGLFLFGERLIIHSAHQFDTSMEAFLRMEALLESNRDLTRRILRVSRSHGSEGFTLRTGQRLRYRTRTKGGGRGFSADCLVLDEGMILPDAFHGVLLPTLSARENPQVWYAGSAVDQLVHEDGLVLSRIRDRAGRGAEGLAYAEWSLDYDDPERVPPRVAASPEAWALANPALGIRIAAEHVGAERSSMTSRTFAVERLNVGDWPRVDAHGDRVIDPERWEALEDPRSQAFGPVCFAIDVDPDRSAATIAAAGKRRDGRSHVEVVERRRGTGWVVGRVIDLRARNESVAVMCDEAGAAGSLIHDFETEGVRVTPVNSRDHARACGHLFDAVEQGTLRHLGQAELDAAVGGATKRPLGGAWAWARRDAGVSVGPLVAVTLALWGRATVKKRRPGVVNLDAIGDE